jgi:2,3-dihydroxybiphenyl 1,2-dioxygenase
MSGMRIDAQPLHRHGKKKRTAMQIIGLGYIGFESPAPLAWRPFGSEVLGLGHAEPPPADAESVYFRLDDRRHRIAIHPGPVDRISYIGWELSGRIGFQDALAKLEAEGIKTQIADQALADLRGVKGMARFCDPAGYAHEIFYAQKTNPRSFAPGRIHGGFAADNLGIGHVVLATPEFGAELEHFMFKVMGFDWFGGGAGVALKMGFYRPPLNPRSHCIGYVHTPGKMGIQHMGLAVKELDDVGIAYDIALQRELPLQWTLGRHVQDPVISFYVFTPSGFPIEYFTEVGHWNEVTEMNPEKLSVWGHKLVGPVLASTVRPLSEHRL